ncbi:hypothetical protein FZEAL_4593 [Fusarium zealandicum]|uniref:Uncharacterized protein n=1 Tax=Fusarium zealandicum TaxID=1053134 RepID=A0A8H4XLR7_9HYPO|nr:hypothetical protein FZEAL_4593 [Fusarium zealandicum]
MSIVPAKVIVRRLYEDTVQDIEYKSASIWQAWLQRRFNAQDAYHFTPEYWLDSSLGRFDGSVRRYDDAGDIIPAMLWVKFKRPSGNVRED